MKTCGALLVLLCCCLAEMQLGGDTASVNDITHQGHYDEAETRENEVLGAAQRTEDAATASTQQTSQPDIPTVLREMSVLVAEQRVELQYTKTQMEALENRLIASEEALETRLSSSEAQLNAIQRENAERGVAFSVSLETTATSNTYTGPFNTGTTLVYKHIFLNTGNAYNSYTGFFTAPVRGVYDFSLSAYGESSSHRVGAHLRRNRQNLIMAYSSVSGTPNASNGVSVLLEVGDVVDVYMPANYRIVDNRNHHSTFRGHLVFKV